MCYLGVRSEKISEAGEEAGPKDEATDSSPARPPRHVQSQSELVVGHSIPTRKLDTVQHLIVVDLKQGFMFFN